MIPKLINGPKGTELIGLLSIKPFSEAQIKPIMEAYSRLSETERVWVSCDGRQIRSKLKQSSHA